MSMIRKAGRALGSALCALGCFGAATGCYTYQTVTPAAVAPGQTVRTRLSGEGMVRLESFFGEPQRLVVGEVVESGNESMLLLTRTRMPMGSMPDDRLRQRIIIQQREIVEVEQRSLDRTRTYVFVGGLAALAGGMLYHFMTGESKGRLPDEPTPGEDLSVIGRFTP